MERMVFINDKAFLRQRRDLIVLLYRVIYKLEELVKKKRRPLVSPRLHVESRLQPEKIGPPPLHGAGKATRSTAERGITAVGNAALMPGSDWSLAQMIRPECFQSFIKERGNGSADGSIGDHSSQGLDSSPKAFDHLPDNPSPHFKRWNVPEGSAEASEGSSSPVDHNNVVQRDTSDIFQYPFVLSL